MAPADDRLRNYREKRDFRKTTEPEGGVKGSHGRLYVIQKHDARRLHYDLRLELDGVLKSWAVTKGPSLDPSDKRLAVRTEDHPVEYGGFEGRIPEGYGAGTVLLWDRGEWRPKGDPHEGLEKGLLKFELKGERLKGGFALVRMKPRKRDKRENWLLVKERDSHADEEMDPRQEWKESIKSGRGMKSVARNGETCQKDNSHAVNKRGAVKQRGSERKSHPEISRRKEAAFPEFVAPQLATLHAEPPSGDDWLHEPKYDGYRIQALIANGAVRLFSRNRKDWTDRYPGVANALAGLGVDNAVIDGEVIVPGKHGGGDFGKLQQATGKAHVQLLYYAFDLLCLDGEDLRRKPLTQRKASLKTLLGNAGDCVRYSDHIKGSGRSVMEHACRMKLEGVVSKKADSPYRSGRGKAWIKSKCVNTDEFIIGGYRRTDKRGRPFASLLLGEYEGGNLIYRGRAGTGFSEKTMRDLTERMKSLERRSAPFNDLPSDVRKDAVWLTPKLVAQIAYSEMTADGHLRHPVFSGLRLDKPAEEVMAQNRKAMQDSDEVSICGVRLTHPDRVMYPGQGATKQEIAEYYAQYASLILRYLGGRPLSLVRCPSGQDGECFFQKHHTDSTPAHLKSVMIEEKDGEKAPYLLIDSADGLAAAAQIGALELHIWGARADRIERPERLVFDLDPDDSVDFTVVRGAAEQLREVLKAAGLVSFPLLTGGKGIHVVVPVERRRGWEDIKTFARGLAEKLAEAEPKRYVANMSKASRKGRIFIDWMRNERGATAIAPYSTRARKGAPLAMPVSWEELAHTGSAAAYTLSDTSALQDHLEKDPWDGYQNLRQSVTNALLDLVA